VSLLFAVLFEESQIAVVKVSTACFKIKSSILWQLVLFIPLLEKEAIISLKKKINRMVSALETLCFL